MSEPVNKAFYNAWLFVSKIPIIVQNPDFPVHSILLYSGGPKDEKQALKWIGDIYLDGSGTKECPFQTPAADISPHFGIFEMWFVLRHLKKEKHTSIYIKVNDFLFTISNDGVIAENGRCTQFLF